MSYIVIINDLDRDWQLLEDCFIIKTFESVDSANKAAKEEIKRVYQHLHIDAFGVYECVDDR